jgi:hypothetical protein
MTADEAIRIKKLLESAFPMYKSKDEVSSDTVFSVALAEYEYPIMAKAAFNYIKNSRYIPTIADLINEYTAIKDQEKQKEKSYLIAYLNKMEDAGLLKPATYGKNATLSEYDILYFGIVEGVLNEKQKEKIIKFANDEKVRKLLFKNKRQAIC